MGTHDHSHDHSECHNGEKPVMIDKVESPEALERRQVLRRLQIATALCVVFFAVEVAGGLLAGSLAILSDAAHLFSDLASFAVAIAANYLASLPSTSQHTYGLKRSESLAALFSMVSLALVCVWLGVEAIQRLIDMIWRPELAAELYQVDGPLMALIAAIGVAVNVSLAYVLGAEGHVHMPGAGGHDHSHDHGHGHNHDDDAVMDETTSLVHSSRDFQVAHANEVQPPQELQPPKPRNVNLQAAYLHVLGDLAQSVAVLVAGLIIWMRPDWNIVDPICTLGFCILVFYSTLSIVRASIAVLLEEVPPNVSYMRVLESLQALPSITDVHCLHIWAISEGKPTASLHATALGDDVGRALRDIGSVMQQHGIGHVTAQVQPASIQGCLTCDEVHETPIIL